MKKVITVAVKTPEELHEFMDQLLAMVQEKAENNDAMSDEMEDDDDEVEVEEDDDSWALDLDIVHDCIIDEKNGKVVLKFVTGDVSVAQTCHGDVFNPEAGILWALSKWLFKVLGEGCTAKEFVDGCLEIADRHKTRTVAKKHAGCKCAKQNKPTQDRAKDMDVTAAWAVLDHLLEKYGKRE